MAGLIALDEVERALGYCVIPVPGKHARESLNAEIQQGQQMGIPAETARFNLFDNHRDLANKHKAVEIARFRSTAAPGGPRKNRQNCRVNQDKIIRSNPGKRKMERLESRLQGSGFRKCSMPGGLTDGGRAGDLHDLLVTAEAFLHATGVGNLMLPQKDDAIAILRTCPMA